MGGLTGLPEDRPTRVRWMVFSLGFGTSWVLYLHRYAFGLIKPMLVDEYGWTKAELGQLDSAFFLFYTGFQVPCGLVADALGVRVFLTGMILFWSAALALHAVAPTLRAMWFVRAAFGVGQAGAYAVLSRITRFWFPPSVRTSVQGWVGVFAGRMGGACSNLLFATVLVGMLHLQWRTSLYLFAAVGGVLGVLFLLLFRDSPRQHPWVNKAEADLIEGEQAATSRPPERLSASALLRRASPRSIFNLMALSFQSFLSTAADNIYVTWIPLFLSEVHGLKFKEMGIYATLPLLGGALGGVVGGSLNDQAIRATGNRRWSRTSIGLAGKGVAAILVATGIILFYDQPQLFCLTLFFVKFFGDWSLAAAWGTVTDIGGRSTATVFAIFNSIGSIASIVAPVVFGGVAQYAGWDRAFVLLGALYGLCALSWLLIDCTIPVLSEEELGG
jgi:MFS transporter, ACS family, glucarate transporter